MKFCAYNYYYTEVPLFLNHPSTMTKWHERTFLERDKYVTTSVHLKSGMIIRVAILFVFQKLITTMVVPLQKKKTWLLFVTGAVKYNFQLIFLTKWADLGFNGIQCRCFKSFRRSVGTVNTQCKSLKTMKKVYRSFWTPELAACWWIFTINETWLPCYKWNIVEKWC